MFFQCYFGLIFAGPNKQRILPLTSISLITVLDEANYTTDN